MDDQDTLCSRMARAARTSTTFSIWPGGDAPGAQPSPVSLFLENDHTGNSAFDRAVREFAPLKSRFIDLKSLTVSAF
jgi:hypothetical protein